MTARLREISDLIIRLRELLNELEPAESGTLDFESEREGDDKDFGCVLKSLPSRLVIPAAETARRVNPVNQPLQPIHGALGAPLPPARIAVLTTKYWGPTPRRLTVSFMESTSSALRSKILQYMNAWTRTGCISFVETGGTGQIRISRGSGGYYSYLGTDILHIPRNRQTMNLQSFTINTPESEYNRVVCHETGHSIGCPHEHMRSALVARIDRTKAYDYFWRTQGWDRQTVDEQVLTPLDERSLMSTPADQDSIMCYQLPGSITRDGRPIRGGLKINATDFAFIGRIYPKPGNRGFDDDGGAGARQPVGPAGGGGDDWSDSEDPEIDDDAIRGD